MRFLGSLLFVVLAVIIAGAMLFVNKGENFERTPPVVSDHVPTSSPQLVIASTSTNVQATSTPRVATTTPEKSTITPKKVILKDVVSKPIGTPPPIDPNSANRIENPYSFPPESSKKINEDTRSALVNILCAPRGGGLLPTSGSGVIIDPRGVILTNAHVAQYVLLSESKNIDLSCLIRAGSPAVPKWHAVVLYIPPVWVDAHVGEIKFQRAYGTGEHDYALLLITDSFDGQTYTTYPYIPVDTRNSIGFVGDPILAASYPAELIGGFAAQNSLYAVSSNATIQKILTFVAQTVDLISLGGVIEAQGGSSGGAVVNVWDRLIGLIVTTSAGNTTGQRDLHALTLSYIDRDLAAQSGHNLREILASDVESSAVDFTQNVAPGLIQKYIDTLTGGRQ